MLQCLLDLLPDNLRFNGSITLEGKTLDSDDIRKCRGNTFSYVPQGVQALNPLLSIEKHLRRASQLSGQAWNAGKIERLLQRSQLESRVLDAFPRQLSGGMAKRVLACHASLSQARYILADEITAWLDAPLANQLLEQLREQCEQGAGVLWVTHDLTLAARHADRIVALHQGRVSDNVSREQLLRGEISEHLQRQWRALPERNQLLESAMLCCREVTICQGGKVLWQNLNFSLRPGERIGVCAPSGTGKTTLGRVLAGWQKPTSGDILVDDQPLPMHQYCPVQLVPQHPELTFNPRRSTGDAVYDAWRPDAELLTRLHINPEWLTRRPGQLSGGELARIALLRALDPRTRFLIADEITAQLDPSIQKDIWVLLLEECQRRPLGMLIISHQQALLDQICSRKLIEA